MENNINKIIMFKYNCSVKYPVGQDLLLKYLFEQLRDMERPSSLTQE